MLQRVAVTFALAATTAMADPGDQLARVSIEDVFKLGRTVVIDEDRVLVSANHRFFLLDVTDPVRPAVLSEHLISNIEYTRDALAMEGDVVLFGSPFDPDVGTDGGAVHVIDISDPAQPAEAVKLTAPDGAPSDQFGQAVALMGDVALISSFSESGSVYAFDVSDPANPSMLSKISASDLQCCFGMGRAMAADGDLLLVADYGNGAGDDVVQVFDYADPMRPSLVGVIALDDDNIEDDFGAAVDLSYPLAVIGAPPSGEAYLFDLSEPSSPEYITTLKGADVELDGYAESVAIDGEVAIVGAWRLGLNNRGAAYLFNLTDPANPIEKKVVAQDESENDHFGYAVAIQDGLAVVGARCANLGQQDLAGAAYVFEAGLCPADVTHDWSLNLLDFVAFQLLWQSMEPAADCNDDGRFDVLDFVCFQQLFQKGCS